MDTFPRAAALNAVLVLAVIVPAALVLAYRRAGLATATLVLGALLLGFWLLGGATPAFMAVLSLPWALMALLNLRPLRLVFMTRPFLKNYLKMLPSMSSTEREALEAGTVWWDGELFSGGPHWPKLMSAKVPMLSAEEQAFLDGPVRGAVRTAR